MEKYHKLIRDKIPQIIESQGKKCITQVLDRENYLRQLDEKLNEELAEYQQDKSMEELADLLEVMHAVAEARGCTWEKLESIREAKRIERGGFQNRILLLEVSD